MPVSMEKSSLHGPRGVPSMEDFAPVSLKNLPRTAFREAFIARIDGGDISIAELARATGVPKPTLDKLHQRRSESTSVANAIRIAAYYGQTIEGFIGIAEDPAVNRLLTRWAELSEGEREILERMIQGLQSRQ